MKTTAVTCPCGRVHEVPLGVLAAVQRSTDVPGYASIVIPCPPPCAKTIVREAMASVREPVTNDDKRTTEIGFDNIEHETPDAVMFEIDNLLVWLPKSKIEFDRDDHTIELPEWLATEKGLV